MQTQVESSSRSIAKSLSYRLLGSLSTGALIFFLTGDLRLSIGGGALDSVVKLILYFAHERVWARIPYGRRKSSTVEI